jgi:hypothetical protein
MDAKVGPAITCRFTPAPDSSHVRPLQEAGDRILLRMMHEQRLIDFSVLKFGAAYTIPALCNISRWSKPASVETDSVRMNGVD